MARWWGDGGLMVARWWEMVARWCSSHYTWTYGRSSVQESTGQGAWVYELSTVALVGTHGWPPTVMRLSAGVSESVWPETVRVPPALPVDGEVASSCGGGG